MEVLGMSSKAGICQEDTRRSLRGVRVALDVDIIDEGFRNAILERMEVSKWSECASKAENYLEA